jgi:hypothetical protein
MDEPTFAFGHYNVASMYPSMVAVIGNGLDAVAAIWQTPAPIFVRLGDFAMLRSLFQSAARCWRRAAIVLPLAAVAGCASWDWRGPGFKDQPNIGRSADPLFPATKGNGFFGQSTKARQIERNLGVE